MRVTEETFPLNLFEIGEAEFFSRADSSVWRNVDIERPFSGMGVLKPPPFSSVSAWSGNERSDIATAEVIPDPVFIAD